MRLGHVIPTKAKLVLYKSVVTPYLTYVYFHLVGHFCRFSDARELRRLDERGLREMKTNKHPRYSNFGVLKKAELPTLMTGA